MTQRGRGDWKCVSVRGGALSMEMDGLLSTLKLPADNWDMRPVVSRGRKKCNIIYLLHINFL